MESSAVLWNSVWLVALLASWFAGLEVAILPLRLHKLRAVGVQRSSSSSRCTFLLYLICWSLTPQLELVWLQELVRLVQQLEQWDQALQPNSGWERKSGVWHQHNPAESLSSESWATLHQVLIRSRLERTFSDLGSLWSYSWETLRYRLDYHSQRDLSSLQALWC